MNDQPTTAPFPLRPKLVGDLEDHDVAAEAKRRAEARILLRSLARTVVSLAAEAGGHDPRYHRPADTITADNIAEQLIAVMEARAVELPATFRQASAEEDMRRASAVAAALSGKESAA
jgi:hypothetical protein